MPHDKTRELTAFEFDSQETKKRADAWMAITSSKIKNSGTLNHKDLKKISELLDIILTNGEYKVPQKRGEHSKRLISQKQLICWHVIKTEMEQTNISKTEAKEITASRFGITQKTVEEYCTLTRKQIESLIQEHGFKEISSGFEYHLKVMSQSKNK